MRAEEREVGSLGMLVPEHPENPGRLFQFNPMKVDPYDNSAGQKSAAHQSGHSMQPLPDELAANLALRVVPATAGQERGLLKKIGKSSVRTCAAA